MQKPPAVDYEGLQNHGYNPPVVQVDVSPAIRAAIEAKGRAQARAIVEKRRKEEEEEEACQQSFKAAKRLLAEERRENRMWGRIKDARRAANKGGKKGQSGQWVEGMASVVRRNTG